MLTQDKPRALTILEGKSFAEIVRELIFSNLAASSARAYQRTYDHWLAYCSERGQNPLAFSYIMVQDFIRLGNVSKATRQAKLAHMRKLLKVIAAFDLSAREVYYQVTKVLKVQGGDMGRKTSKRALTVDELKSILAVWADDERPVGRRNYAMMRLLIFTGARRAEIAALRWDDIDLDNLTVRIRHGKGDKERVATILPDFTAAPIDGTLTALRELYRAQAGEYSHVFPRMSAAPNPRFVDDFAIQPQTVAVVVRLTSKRAGIGHFSPHDIRRTLATRSLEMGAPLAAVQAQLGHANASTTMLYALAPDAAARRQIMRLG